MALFNECMQSCAHIVLDTADIVRDGDFSTARRELAKALPCSWHGGNARLGSFCCVNSRAGLCCCDQTLWR